MNDQLIIIIGACIIILILIIYALLISKITLLEDRVDNLAEELYDEIQTQSYSK